ncbi:SusC/RagA family TonB-linked outer membrane protein [Parapedobacter composti]|nr:SusC/RagA family TonB-linked outer membrane protein [Parapedobacter composti]
MHRDTHEGIAGATVKYRQQQLASDDGGSFLLAVPHEEKRILLSIAAIGFEPKDTIVSLPVRDLPLIIQLTPTANVLDEVVVSTGYQQLPRERATGSFGFVDQKTFNEQVGTDVISRLEAVANSLQVDRTGSGERLLIRGLSTIQGPTQPLIVLDNFPYEGNLENINPNDVESITILKDAAAASIWGARAGNGVIVITTKKGKLRQPLRIEFNSNVTTRAKPDLFYVREIAASDFIDVEQMLYNAGYYTAQINNRSKPALSPVVELLLWREGATADEAALIDAEIDRLRNVDVRHDFDNYVYQRAWNQQYFLGIREGGDQTAWNLSAGYDRNADNLNARYDRLNLRIQHVIMPWKNFSINSGLYYTQSGTESGKEGYGQVTAMNNGLFPYAELADGNGNALPVIKQVRKHFLDTEADPRLLDWRYYPLEDYRHVINTTSLTSLLANAGLRYTLPVGLGASIDYQYERQQRNGRNLRGEESFFARDLINRFSQRSADGELIRAIPFGAVMDLSESLLQSHNVRGQFNFARDWEKHGLSAIVGGEVRSVNTTSSSNRFYGYDSDILTFANVDYNHQYPDYISGINAFIPDEKRLANTTDRYVSFYANAAYVYSKKYSFSLSGRRDASNMFGLNTNDKWNLLWSSGLSWDVSKETFYNATWLPQLKLRGTYGRSGNVNPDMVALTTIQYRPTLAQITQAPYATFSNFANPELAWETVSTLNVGLDFAFTDSRVSGSVEYYRKKGTNLYGPAPVDYTTGIGYTITKNVASMVGNGWDMELNTINLKGKLGWRSHLNVSVNKEEVADYYLRDRRGNRFVAYSNLISGITGKPVRSMFSYRWAGLNPETGQPMGYLGDEPSTDYRALTGNDVLVDDLIYHGSTLPICFGTLGNTLSYRGVSLSVRLLYKFGYYFRRQTISYSDLFRSWRGHGDFYNRWQQPGDERYTDVPAMIYPMPAAWESFYPFAEPFVEHGDHIRFQYVNIGYEFTRAAFPRLPAQRVNVYLNFSNLGLIWKATKQPIDPDFSSATSTGIPAPFTATFGLRIDL